jgi:hypothetical protein
MSLYALIHASRVVADCYFRKVYLVRQRRPQASSHGGFAIHFVVTNDPDEALDIDPILGL